MSLLTHGLNAISVYSDLVSARLLAVTAAFGLIAGSLGTLGLLGGFATGMKLPPWLFFATAVLLMFVLQSLAFATIFVFTIANRRSTTSFILQRDGPYFVLGTTVISKQPQLGNLNMALLELSQAEVQEVRK